MKVKSMKSFRHWFKMSKQGTRGEAWMSDFMGYMHDDKMGFFAMYHGEKPDIYGFLRKETEMAEDGQAIYEFVQNAADSNSTHFYMFYNDKYLLVINNGEQFTRDGVKSILNVGQSHGKEDNPDKIGRFGIGFKLVHRLVGKSNGLKELTEDYCGPQMFSWGKKKDFLDFANSEAISEDEDPDSSDPWLMKILITNFPSSANETVKDINFNDRVLYTRHELDDFRRFLSENISSIDTDAMNSGTMFFIRLGEGKVAALKKDQNDINNRLENTLYFLKNLTHLQVNNKIISRDKDFIIEDKFLIQPGTEEFEKVGLEEKRDKKFPIVLQFGYSPYGSEKGDMKSYPNFYKYFPMEDTTYGLQFIFHSNVFSIGSNRRHIHEDHINEALLDLLANKICRLVDKHIENKSDKVCHFAANLLLSDRTEPFVDANLLSPLFNYLKNNVPTDKGEFKPAGKVIIKNTKLPCNPSDFGLDLSWFKWDASEDETRELIRQAKDDSKLGLKSYTLKKLLEAGNISSINAWIRRLGDDRFGEFIEELEKNIPDNI